MIVPKKRLVPQLEMQPDQLFRTGELLAGGKSLTEASQEIGRDILSFRVPAMTEYMRRMNLLEPQAGETYTLGLELDVGRAIRFEYIETIVNVRGTRIHIFRSVAGGYRVSFTEFNFVEAWLEGKRLARKEEADQEDSSERRGKTAVA